MENKIIHPLPITTTVVTDKGVAKIAVSVANFDYWIYTLEYNSGLRENVLSDLLFFNGFNYCVMEKPNPQTEYNVGVDGNKDMVNHPTHYGGKDNPFEVIKIIDHYNLPFSLANTLKYILRSDKKGNKLEDLKKAAWYLQHEITKLEHV